jgi:betaine-aldehyde dehydrogenase
LHAGVVWINNYNLSPAELPWGGFKNSGIGSENGLAGVEAWTRMKSVYVEMDEMQSPF